MGYIEFYVILFLIFGTAIFVMIGLGINILASPMTFFIGGMSTAPPDSTELDFLKGFFFIQAIPLLILIIGILKWIIDRGKINELINRIAL